MTDPWVCLDCGGRQANQGQCAACKHDDTLDLRDEKVRELMRDVDQRLADRRDGRFRFIGVAVGMVVVFALWLVPGYWTFRSVYAIPLLIDQWIVMALIGFGVVKLLGKLVKPRFPYLKSDLTVG